MLKNHGEFRVLDIQKNCMVIKVVLNKNNHMNYHSHQHRDEIWIAVSGNGKVIIDDEIKSVNIEIYLLLKQTKETYTMIAGR